MMRFSIRNWLLVGLILSAAFKVDGTFRTKVFNKIFRTSASIAAAVCIGNPQISLADAGAGVGYPVVTYNKVGQDDIKCSVKLPQSIKATGPYGQGSNAAIILTAKQDAAQIFNSRTQVKNSKTYNFPSDITLYAQNDLTPEGKTTRSQWRKGEKTFTVSAYLDVDGVLSTTGPQDLKGKAIVSKDSESNNWLGCEIELEPSQVASK